ncbi:MAG: cytochrome c biogenesis protein CcsA [Gammaproteobacteria bacterium]|nr:cytochrome c biogenesis protein CcsA [Gammaproteobacteria bacterium]
MTTIITITAIALYLLATSLLGLRLKKGLEASSIPKKLAIGLGLAAVVLHTQLLYGSLFTMGGMDLAFFNVLSLVSALIALLILITAINQPVENLGIAALPLAALGIILQQGLSTDTHNLVAINSTSVQIHILLSILSYSLLSIAAVQAVLLAIQDRHLRGRHPGGFIRALPPLETMESLLFQMIGIGYVTLSLALLVGITFLQDIFAQHLVHKTVLSIIAWTVFAILLRGRWKYGWRGRVAIRWTLIGFVFLMLAYFGSKLVLELILKT